MVGFFINKNSKKIDNQLVLRNMFSEKLRWEVHRTIETGDVSYWYKQSKEDIPKEFLENNENSWTIKDDKIQFTNLNKMTEYYNLVNQIID